MSHDGKVRRDDGHGQHGCDKNLSRQHMARGTFAERHCRCPGQQPQAPSANMNNQYGRIGHCPLLEIYTWIGAPVFRPTAISTVAIPAVPFLVCDPRAPTPKSSRSSPATSPPTEAIPLSETLCAAARTHARPAHTNASPREPQPSSEQCSKPVSRLRCSEEGWGSRGEAFVCPGRACVRAAAHQVSDNRMASVGGDVAGHDRHDFAV